MTSRWRVLVAALLVASSAAAAEVALEPPTGAVHLGDVVALEARVPLEPGEEARDVTAPGGDESLLVRSVRLDEAEPGRVLVEVQPFALGALALEGLELTVSGADDTTRTVAIGGTSLEVVAALPEEEEGHTPAGLAPPVEVPVRRARLAALALGSAALLAAVAFAIAWVVRRLWRRRVRGEAPPVPPHVAAMEALERLAEGAALRDGDVRRFHIELAAILKHYLEGRYAFPAAERTTAELGRDLRALELDAAVHHDTIAVLNRCDEVKFAGDAPAPELARKNLEAVRGVVELTAPIAEPSAPEATP